MLRYPRMVFQGDSTLVVADKAALLAAHARGYVATALEGDDADEQACYRLDAAPPADAPEDAPDPSAEPPVKRGRKPKPTD